MVDNLATLSLSQARLLTNQLNAILTAALKVHQNNSTLFEICENFEDEKYDVDEKKLVSLNLSHNDCSSVPDNILSLGVSNIYRVNLGNIID